ncbi:hypothetical protein [Terrabacter sp. C0L_2]|uniref:hypothetical protein n=1 Tax=Terrabacter sp. C0L_2 TaxID=3108389 RepID=UPI002ED21503|nr:hypothetical protein U5C87_09750 [Terrabacter sp. C0L_2]
MTTFWEKAPPAPPVRPRRARWSRPVAVVVVVSVIGLVGFLVLSAVGLWLYANHDRPELIDRPDVVAVVEDGCARLRADLAAHPVPTGAAPSVRAAAISAQDEAIRAFVAHVRTLDAATRADDLPVDDWLSDWERLARARDDVSDALGRGVAGVLVVPRDQGRPVTTRMSAVGVTCVDLARLVRRT